MADHEPLVEFFAAVKSTRKGNAHLDTRYGKKLDPELRDFQTLTVTLVLSDPDDIRAVDDATSGPQAGRELGFRVFAAEAVERSHCDPNQEPVDEAAPDDELAKIRRSYVRLMQATTDETSAPDSAAG